MEPESPKKRNLLLKIGLASAVLGTIFYIIRQRPQAVKQVVSNAANKTQEAVVEASRIIKQSREPAPTGSLGY